MRNALTCPFRHPLSPASPDPEPARIACAHLIETLGLEDPSLAEVPPDVCRHCCTLFEPKPLTPNPAVASRLVRLTDQIITRGGVPGCPAAKAEDLRLLGLSHLQVMSVGNEEAQQSRISRSGPCLYLGAETGWRSCQDCPGEVRRRTFQCHHPTHHQDTTVRACQACVDYDAPLSPGGVSRWALGVTTAPRRQATLETSLQSLAQAGWENPYIFAEPDTVLPDDLKLSGRLIQRPHVLGAWPHFLLALTELHMLHPQADAYLLCQDDVLYARDLRAYLEDTLWPDSRLGVVSLHTAAHQDRGDAQGFWLAHWGWDAWGAQAYVFPNFAVRAFLSNPGVINHRHRGPRQGLCNVDSVVGRWAEESGLGYYLHTPSLTQHIGDTSTLWPTARTRGRRRAATFTGQTTPPTP